MCAFQCNSTKLYRYLRLKKVCELRGFVFCVGLNSTDFHRWGWGGGWVVGFLFTRKLHYKLFFNFVLHISFLPCPLTAKCDWNTLKTLSLFSDEWRNKCHCLVVVVGDKATRAGCQRVQMLISTERKYTMLSSTIWFLCWRAFFPAGPVRGSLFSSVLCQLSKRKNFLFCVNLLTDLYHFCLLLTV